jgi:hypothetical protein
MLRPKRCPNVEGFAPQQQVHRHIQHFFNGRSDRLVVKGRLPSAIRKTAARILVRSASCLYDAIKGNVFKYGDFSHD